MIAKPKTNLPLPLSSLEKGDVARICDQGLACDECELLSAMGLTNACRIRVHRAGRTCIIDVNSTRLGMTASIADRIMAIREPVALDAG